MISSDDNSEKENASDVAAHEGAHVIVAKQKRLPDAIQRKTDFDKFADITSMIRVLLTGLIIAMAPLTIAAAQEKQIGTSDKKKTVTYRFDDQYVGHLKEMFGADHPVQALMKSVSDTLSDTFVLKPAAPDDVADVTVHLVSKSHGDIAKEAKENPRKAMKDVFNLFQVPEATVMHGGDQQKKIFKDLSQTKIKELHYGALFKMPDAIGVRTREVCKIIYEPWAFCMDYALGDALSKGDDGAKLLRDWQAYMGEYSAHGSFSASLPSVMTLGSCYSAPFGTGDLRQNIKIMDSVKTSYRKHVTQILAQCFSKKSAVKPKSETGSTAANTSQAACVRVGGAKGVKWVPLPLAKAGWNLKKLGSDYLNFLQKIDWESDCKP